MDKKLSFKEIINQDKPTLVDFFADWCSPCKAMESILIEVADTVGEKANIVTIDVDKHEALIRRLKINVIPTFILYHKGEIKWRQSGMQSAYALTQVINQMV